MFSTIDPVVLILGTAALTTLIWVGIFEWLMATDKVDSAVAELRSQPSLDDHYTTVVRD